jgi:hypothetical protein
MELPAVQPAQQDPGRSDRVCLEGGRIVRDSTSLVSCLEDREEGPDTFDARNRQTPGSGMQFQELQEAPGSYKLESITGLYNAIEPQSKQEGLFHIDSPLCFNQFLILPHTGCLPDLFGQEG